MASPWKTKVVRSVPSIWRQWSSMVAYSDAVTSGTSSKKPASLEQGCRSTPLLSEMTCGHPVAPGGRR